MDEEISASLITRSTSAPGRGSWRVPGRWTSSLVPREASRISAMASASYFDVSVISGSSSVACIVKRTHHKLSRGISRALARLTHVLGTVYLEGPDQPLQARPLVPFLSPVSPPFIPLERAKPPLSLQGNCVTAVYGHSLHPPANKTDTPAQPAHLECPSPCPKPQFKYHPRLPAAPVSTQRTLPTSFLRLPHVYQSIVRLCSPVSHISDRPHQQQEEESLQSQRPQPTDWPCSSPTNARRTYSRRQTPISIPALFRPPASSGTSSIPTFLALSERQYRKPHLRACLRFDATSDRLHSFAITQRQWVLHPGAAHKHSVLTAPTTPGRNSDTYSFQPDISPETRPRTRARPERRSLIPLSDLRVRIPSAPGSTAREATFRTVTAD